jgi:hypothetical protein
VSALLEELFQIEWGLAGKRLSFIALFFSGLELDNDIAGQSFIVAPGCELIVILLLNLH